MGIKGLTKFIKEKFNCAYITSPISVLKYEKVAIDTSLYMFKYKSSNAEQIGERYFNPDRWLWSFVYLVYNLRKNNIHPIFVFEGGSPPEKTNTREERKHEREKVKSKTISLEESIERARQAEDDEAPKDLNDEWIKILKKNKLPLDYPFDLEAVSEHVQKRHRYDVTVRSRDYEKLKLLLKILKVSVLQAPMEAEALCTFLEKEGAVAAVVSNDSDVLAYGCKKLIVDFNFDNNETDTIIYIDNDILKDSMAFDQFQFLDFCIMCGTDYNKNIFRVGPVAAHKLISIHTKIENINHLDTSILNYERVRDIFTSFGMENTNAEELCKFNDMCLWSEKPDFDLLFLFLTKVNIEIDFEWMKDGFLFNETFSFKESQTTEDSCPVF